MKKKNLFMAYVKVNYNPEHRDLFGETFDKVMEAQIFHYNDDDEITLNVINGILKDSEDSLRKDEPNATIITNHILFVTKVIQ